MQVSNLTPLPVGEGLGVGFVAQAKHVAIQSDVDECAGVYKQTNV
jgi:hypothetical protein